MSSNVHQLGAQGEPRVTITQLAKHFAMSERWVRYRIQEGMPHKRHGRSLRFVISDVTAWLDTRYHDAA